MMLSGSRITQLDLWFGYVNAFLYILLKYFIYGFAIRAMTVSNSKPFCFHVSNILTSISIDSMTKWPKMKILKIGLYGIDTTRH